MITLPDGQVERFRGWVAERLGLHLEDGRQAWLAETLGTRIRTTGAQGFEPYMRMLAGPNSADELRALASELTVGETYFFRNPDHFQAFSRTVLPERLRARADAGTLRILSAGCSSGDEAHTLAILLREHPGLREWKLSITGIDVNPAMVAKATRGVYSAWSLRQTPAEVKARWFRQTEAELALDEQIRGMVRFEERNLIDDDPAFWRSGSFDVVFCRNVTMYFPLAVARKVVGRIAAALTPGGYLFLGHAETLRGVSHHFHLRHTDETFYYQRQDSLEPELMEPPGLHPPVAISVDGDLSWAEVIHRSTERIADLASAPRAGPNPRAGGWDLGAARALLEAERFTEALALLGDLPPASQTDSDAHLLRAALLTHSGHLGQAEVVCKELLAFDELNAGAHYLMALCREHAGDKAGAIEHDLKAAYLDPEFAMPRLHLGLLARRRNDHPDARRHLEEASVLLVRENPARILLFGGGFHREALALLCRSELETCGSPE